MGTYIGAVIRKKRRQSILKCEEKKTCLLIKYWSQSQSKKCCQATFSRVLKSLNSIARDMLVLPDMLMAEKATLLTMSIKSVGVLIIM